MHRLFILSLAIHTACGGASPTPKGCAVDRECPLLQYCDYTTSTCDNGCVTNSECTSPLVCTDHGRCLSSADATNPDASMRDLSAYQDGGVLLSLDLPAPPLNDLAASGDLASACIADASEPDNTTFYASPETDNAGPATHQICPTGDVDMFYVTTSKAGQLTATVARSAPGLYVDVNIFASDGVTKVASSTRTPNGSATATLTVTNATHYYLQVTGDSPGIVAYTLSTQNQ